MFNALRHNHNNVHKRLGDGFYEQRLINEQINQLTGRRYIEGYTNDLAQYKALMHSGVKYAQQLNLSVGIGLTAKQMSELTTDMVWLVNKEITLADGRKVTALVPQVYLVARNSDITSRGAVISANQIIGNVDNLQNSGVIAGLDLTRLHSNELENRGTILGDTVDLSAKQNLVNLGGKIEAVKDLSLYAGKNLEISSTLSSSQSADGNFARTVLDQLASVKVTGEGGRLTLHSDDNLTIKAANIESQGSLKATSDKALSITTLNVSNKEHYNGNADNYYRLDQQGEIGSTLRGKDGVHLVGMENATLRQATVSSENGETFIGSRDDVRIESGEQTEQLASSSKGSSKGWFSKTTETRRHYHDTTENIGSEIDGNNVTLYSETGKVDIHGSAVVADKQLLIDSKEGVNITAATNTHYAEDEHIKTKRGLMGTGGIGVSVGKKKEQIEQDYTQQSAARSQVGSLSGDTIIRTDGHYQQTGSVVTSRDGDVDITAKSATITAARSDYESNYKRMVQQKGFTFAVSSPVTNAIQAVEKSVNSAKSVGSSKNDRINALGAVNAGFEAMRTAEQVGKLAEALSQNPTQALSQDVSVSITYGEQKSVETQHSEGSKAEKSQINAGGKVNIKTEGGGKNSTLTIAGSDVSGKGGTHLKAEGDVNILAVDENHLERSKNKSSGFNAGVAISYGSSGFAFGVTAGGNVAKGYGNGESQAWVGSQVGSLDSRTTIESGGDANIISSQVKGKSVKVNAENLHIQSLQDTMKYEGKQESASGQVTVGYGVSGSASYSKSKMSADMATVGQQAGIFAGDEGYDIDIQNHTELTAGLVTSTEKAEAEGKNRFSTGTLSYSHIENHADYKGSAVGVSAAGDYKGGWNGQKVDKEGNPIHSLSNAIGYGKEQDNQAGTTYAGINTQNLIIKNEQAQLETTGKTAAQIKEEAKTDITTDTAESRSGKLENNFDKSKLQKELDYQVKVIQEFDQNRKEATDYLYRKAEEKRAEAAEIRRNTEIDGKTGYNTEASLELERKADIYDTIAFGADLALGTAYGWGNKALLGYAGTGAVTTPVINAATAPEQIWITTCQQDSLYCADNNMDGSQRPMENGKAQIGNKRQIFDISEIKPSETSRVITLSNNGILNPLDDALKNAVKQNKWETNKDGIVVVYNRPTGNYVSELLYAAYDKTNDLLGGRLPLTTAEKANLKLYEYAKQNNYVLDISSHSRGGLTASVALQEANRIGLKNIPIRESRFFGTATNVKDYAGYLKENNSNVVARSAVHKADFVGNKWNLGLFGGFNDTTGGNCIFCYSHSSYFAERPSEHLVNDKGQFIDLKGNMVGENNKVKNQYLDEFNTIWKPVDKVSNPSLPKVVLPKEGDN